MEEQVFSVDEKKVKTFAAAAGLYTDKSIAEASGVSHDTLKLWFSGAEWSSGKLKKLALALNCNPLDLLTIKGYPPPHVGAPAIAGIF